MKLIVDSFQKRTEVPVRDVDWRASRSAVGATAEAHRHSMRKLWNPTSRSGRGIGHTEDGRQREADYFRPPLAGLLAQSRSRLTENPQDFVFCKEDVCHSIPMCSARRALSALDRLGIARARRAAGFTPFATLRQPSSTKKPGI